MGMEDKGFQVRRREFIKTTTMAGMAATIPGSKLVGQETSLPPRPRPTGKNRHVLFLSETPSAYAKLIDAIKASKEFDFTVTATQVNYQKAQEIVSAVQSKNPDILLIVLGRVTTSSGGVPAALGALNIPVILLPVNLDLIMLEADMVAAFRAKGTPAMLANSEAHVVELLKIAATPRVLEGKKAVIFGRPFDSSSVPAPNLSEDYIFKRTGVRLQYRQIDELKQRLSSVDESAARKEMERWKKEAAKVVEASDQAILDASRLYVLLRSIAEKEGLSAISIDCLGFSFSANPILPYPCLSFTRLRDDGFAAPCEADVCASISSMLLQEISRRSSYFCNVSSVDESKSTVVLRHCVAPLKLMGANAPALTYNLRDYHGTGRGVVPEVDFPLGVDVMMGGFSKDLNNFAIWPGRTQAGARDTERPSFENAPPAYSKMRRYCSNRVEVKIKDVGRFIQNIAGCHYVLVAGNFMKDIRDEMLRMNVNIISPFDVAAPEA